MIKKRLSYKLFNPNYWHIRKAMKDATIRYIIAYGGSSSSKSYSVAQSVLIDMMNSGDNTMVMRKVGASIKNSIYKTFVGCSKRFCYKDEQGIKTPIFICQENLIKCTLNDSYISFCGIDDPEKIKGLESYKRLVLEEFSDFEEEDFNQLKLRLRGVIGQQFICMFNPISELHWIKKTIFDREQLIEQPVYIDGITAYEGDKHFKLSREYTSVTSKWTNTSKKLWNDRINDYEDYPADMVIIKSTYLNNFWVNGSPSGTYGNYDRQTISNFDDLKSNNFPYYQIYALGEWGTIKTGGEFLPGFDLNKHVKACTYNSLLPIHISIDNNVLPYITATFFQTVDNKVYQIHEICAEEPNNTATQAAQLAVDYLNDLGYDDIVILYGDATTKAKNTIDDNKLSFFDKYKSVLELSYVVTEKVQSSNPSVSLSGEFVNEILKGTQGIEFCVDPHCTNSINDYVNAKKDENGGMLKKRVRNKLTGQTYEELGHCVDTARYQLVMCFNKQYNQFSNKRKRNKIQEDDMKYFKEIPSNHETIMLVVPIINDKFGYIVASLSDNEVFINDAYVGDFIETEQLNEIASNYNPTIIQVSSLKPDYLFSLRQLIDDIDVIGKKASTISDDKINANLSRINEFKFKFDYDNYPEYSDFVNNLLDYKKGGSNEAITILAYLSEYLLSSK